MVNNIERIWNQAYNELITVQSQNKGLILDEGVFFPADWDLKELKILRYQQETYEIYGIRMYFLMWQNRPWSEEHRWLNESINIVLIVKKKKR